MNKKEYIGKATLFGKNYMTVYKPVIQELLAKGFKVFLYSDMIKRYKETEQYIKSVRNRNFEYCSSKLALV